MNNLREAQGAWRWAFHTPCAKCPAPCYYLSLQNNDSWLQKSQIYGPDFLFLDIVH
jgi:hypothetical protein